MKKKLLVMFSLAMGLFILLGFGGQQAEATTAKNTYFENQTEVTNAKSTNPKLVLKGEVTVTTESEATTKYAKIYTVYNNRKFYDSCAKLVSTTPEYDSKAVSYTHLDVYKRQKYRNKVPVALTVNEQKQLEYFAFKEKGCSAIILALYSGLRIGEISGLKWSDIDFENGTIYVNRTIFRVNSHSEGRKTEVLVGIPKTDQSSRVVPLAGNLKNYLLAKKALSASSYVVSCKNKMTEPRVIRYRFKKVVEASGIRNIHFHSLRHTFATRCLEERVDISSLSKLLGHTSAKMTLDTYADSVLESRQKAIFKIDKLMTYQLD
nr:hypothetical protein A5881_000592 [Enterococcus termitis]